MDRKLPPPVASPGRASPAAVTAQRGSSRVQATSFSGATLLIQSSSGKDRRRACSTTATSSRLPGEYGRHFGANRPSNTRYAGGSARATTYAARCPSRRSVATSSSPRAACPSYTERQNATPAPSSRSLTRPASWSRARCTASISSRRSASRSGSRSNRIVSVSACCRIRCPDRSRPLRIPGPSGTSSWPNPMAGTGGAGSTRPSGSCPASQVASPPSRSPVKVRRHGLLSRAA